MAVQNLLVVKGTVKLIGLVRLQSLKPWPQTKRKKMYLIITKTLQISI